MDANINPTFISLTLLSCFIIFSLSWLVLKTLKEGRLALKENNKASKKQSQKKLNLKFFE